MLTSGFGPPPAHFFHAVKYTIENFEFPPEYFTFQPLEGTKLRMRLVGEKDDIYLASDDTVYKLFDLTIKSYAKPNVDIIKTILGQNYLMDIKERFLSSDKCFRCLTYNYIKARSTSDYSIEDFKPIMRDLDRLHAGDYMHSNV